MNMHVTSKQGTNKATEQTAQAQTQHTQPEPTITNIGEMICESA
jgi:hypothetical protein